MSRVAQLDSFLLDNELNNILAAPVSDSAEFRLALKVALLYLGLKSGASYGAKLQNLKYTASSKLRWIYVILATVPEYLIAKARDRMLVRGWSDYPRARSLSRDPARRRRELKRIAWDTLVSLENFWQTAKLVNFLLFLYNGRYPTLLTRLLRLRFSYAQKSVARNVSFDFLNRQLVWEAFTEFLLFMMPLVDLQAIQKWVAKMLRTQAPKSSTSSAPLAHLPAHVCAICHSKTPVQSEPMDPVDPMTSTAFLATLGSEAGQEATVPYATDCCGGRYCYYCISSTLYTWEKEREDDNAAGWPCLRCGKPVLSVSRWLGAEEQGKEKEDQLVA